MLYEVITQLKLELHPLGDRKTTHRTSCQADAIPAAFYLPVQVIVAAVRVVMEEAEPTHSGFDGKIRGIGEGGVAPPASMFVFLLRVLGIVKQQVRASAETP